MVQASGLRIGRVLGIPIYLHPTWFLIFVLISFSLATQFKQQHPGWSDTQHWGLGILTSLFFFACVLFHELAHSVVAIHYRIPVVSITLFVFGGVARIGREPASAKQEFNIAVAGPLSSYLLAGAFWLVRGLFPSSEMLGALAFWLFWVNAMLATFNLVPGFPLDGGRIFRAIVWGITNNFARATKIAARSGQLIAYGMIVWGAVWALNGKLIDGLWLAFIGWFLLTASQESVAQVAVRGALAGLRAADVMNTEVPTVGREISLESYGQEVLRTGRRCHMVILDGRLLGMMNVHALNRVPREEWAINAVQSVMVPPGEMIWTTPDEPLLPLLERILASDVNQVPVISGTPDDPAGTQILGMVTSDSILRVIQLHTEFGKILPA